MDFEVIVRINDYINGVVWGVPVLVLIALLEQGSNLLERGVFLGRNQIG